MKFSDAINMILIGHRMTRESWDRYEYLCVKEPSFRQTKDVDIVKCTDYINKGITKEHEYILTFDDADAYDWVKYNK